MLARSEFRNNATVLRVGVELRGHNRRQMFAPVFDHGSCGLIAGTFNA